MERGSGSAADRAGGSGDGPNEPPTAVLTSVELVDYITCPLLYCFKHVMCIEDGRPPSVSELWGLVLDDMFIWIHAQLLEGRSLSWSDLLEEWELRWGQAGKTTGANLAEMVHARNRGARHLRDLFDSLQPRMEVLGVRYPCRREISGFVVEAEVPVIRVLEQQDKGKSGREIQIISMDPISLKTPTDFEACRDFGFVFDKYGLEMELRHRFKKVASKVVSMVYLPRIPKLAEVKIPELAGRQTIRWASWILDSIRLGHFYPRAGAHCSACFYQPVCDVRYVSNRSLSNPETPDKIRRQLCQE